MYSQPGALTVQHDNQQHGGDNMVLGDPATSNGQRKARSVALDLQQPAEKTLVEAAKGGHSTAFDTLCERYAQQLLRAAHRITRSREDAEDAVQDALLSAFIHLRDFDGRSSFATWLTRIGINSALMVLRKRRSWREIYVDDSIDPHGNQTFWDVPDPSPDPENLCHQRERKEALERAIGQLRPGIREVIELGQLQEHRIRQAAGIMGISVAAAKARLFHGRRALRNSKALRTVCSAESKRRAARLGMAA
jgi:RNA polymerase sigma factor (sigma-70 family)